MSWQRQKIALVVLLCAVIGILMFCLGVAFGLSQEPKGFLQNVVPILSLFGTWLASLGTIAAVVVSLWLANAEKRADAASIQGMLAYALLQGVSGNRLVVNVTANGKRPVLLNSISVCSSNAGSKLLVTTFDQLGSQLPQTLNYGEEALFIFKQGTLGQLFKYIREDCSGETKGLKVVVKSTLSEYEVRLPTELRQLLRKQAQEEPNDQAGTL